jgi:di/tricarboxylate transporter
MWLTAAVIVVVLVLLIGWRAPPDLTLLGGILVLMVAGVVTPREGLSGFANEGMLTVAALLIVAAGLQETGAVERLCGRMLGRAQTARAALVRLLGPVLFSSAFLNNTAVVAALMPGVHDWSRRANLPPSRLLMPLSFGAILGGTCTLIGTSTNLVVSGLVSDQIGVVPGLRPVAMFDISWLGIPVAIAGGITLVLLAPILLPDRRPAVSRGDDPGGYAMELDVPAGSILAGKSIEEAGLRHLPHAFLAEVTRQDGTLCPAVDHHTRLRAGDRLMFVGDVGAMVDLRRTAGLRPAEGHTARLDTPHRVLVEAVVSPRHRLVGRTIREGRFRSTYRAVVLAVARHGERLTGRLGDVILQVGDVLLLEAHPDFIEENRVRTDFYLISPLEGARPPRFERAAAAWVILIVMILLSALEIIPTVLSAALAAAATIATGCCTPADARRALDGTVLVTIAAALGLGAAVSASGLDDAFAGLITAMSGSSPWLALAIIYVATALITELITNNAAAVLLLPLALATATRLGSDPTAFVMTVMMGASASFLTPIGYQTNLMVYGPGGYHPVDYLRLGGALSIIAGIATVGLAPIIWPL